MVLFEDVHHDRRRMGWAGQDECSWVLGPPRNKQEKNRLVQKCLDADVMVFGACPLEVLKARVALGKLTFVSSERILKKPYYHLRMLNPFFFRGITRFRALVNNPHVHALSIGHSAPEDLRVIGAFENRIWKWGYFISTPATLPDPPPVRPLKLLWVGRMLNVKRVDLILKALAMLQDSGVIGGCTIVGEGPERSRLLKLARKLGLSSAWVHFVPFVPFPEVRRLMRESDAYVLTSNRHEGWGAVAGEAMAEGCVLVANEEAGASQELVRDGETGLLFRDGDVEQLAAQLKFLASNYPLRMQMRQKAWTQMQKVWHPRVAAERLVALCDGLLGLGTLPSFADGPCSLPMCR